MNVDLYAALGLPQSSSSSSPREIKKAYIKLARQLHPDKNFGKSSDRFLLVQVAYEILRDAVQKRLYDIGRERRGCSSSSSFPSSSSSSQPRATPHCKRRPPPEAYDWAKDQSAAAAAREADLTRFNLWKEALFRDLDEIDRSLRSMAPSPQKAKLLEKMIDRVDQIRAESMKSSVAVVAAPDSSSSSSSSQSMTFNDQKDNSALCRMSSEDRSLQQSESPVVSKKRDEPSDDFLVFLAKKKKTTQRNKK